MDASDHVAAREYARRWAEAWNSHDLDRVLSHFHPEARFTSPLVPLIAGRANPLQGAAALRGYWAEGLRRYPGLHFEVEDVHLGDGIIAVHYRNERGRPATEVLRLGGDDLVTEGWGLYGPEP